jgi:hypothetical protein
LGRGADLKGRKFVVLELAIHRETTTGKRRYLVQAGIMHDSGLGA